MNIFVLHEDPIIAAQMHCDKHCNKMIVEHAQMLAAAYYSTLGISVLFNAVIGTGDAG